MRSVLLLLLLPVLAVAEPPKTAGWLEWVTFPDVDLKLRAKLDTGAKTSAIDAEEITTFERDGEKWVRFQVRRKRGGLERVQFEGRLVVEKVIRAAVGTESRPAVALWACVAGERRRVLFTLGSREKMNYRVILGRRALEGRLLVDASRKFTQGSACPAAPQGN